MVAHLGEKLDVRPEHHATADVEAACIRAAISRNNGRRRIADACTPKVIARGRRNRTIGGKIQMPVVETVASGGVRGEPLLLDEFICRIRSQAPHAHDGAQGKVHAGRRLDEGILDV